MVGNQVRNHCKHMMDMDESASTSRVNDEYERPFKKARYVWQLKGKYHLKTTSQTANAPTSHFHQDANNSSDTDSDSLLSCEPAPLTQHTSDKETARTQHKFLAEKRTEDVPVTMVLPRNQTQDEYLEHWQASQLAKGYVDNTINSLLELWKIAPLDGDVEDLEHAEDEHVEDEGILMAIQSHGLQTSIPAMHNQGTHQIEVCTEAAGTSQTCTDAASSFIEPSQSQPLENNDFLSAAVTAAIKKKGLSSYNFG